MAVQMDVSRPYNSSPTSEAEWRTFMAYNVNDGVMRSLGNELLPFADSTGMQVKITSGGAWAKGQFGIEGNVATLSIASNASGNPRVDLVVMRNRFNSWMELDVVQGTAAATPVPPALTRNSSVWEVPLGLVDVANGAVTISPANVKDCRQWGGPPVPTVSDDFLLYGDRISSCQRITVSDTNATTNGFLYFVRMHSLGDQTVTQIRMHPTTLPVAGTTSVRIFRGYRQDRLNDFIDPTTSTFLYASGGAASAEHASAIPATTLRAGETIVVAILGLSTTTAAQLSTQSTGALTGGQVSNLLNPDTAGRMVTGFKSGVASMPSTLNLLDGSWTRRDRVPWVALA